MWMNFGMLFLLFKVCSLEKAKIGGIFNLSEETEELAFRYAANLQNHYDLKLSSVSALVDESNVLEVTKSTCSLLQNEIVAIFGPSSEMSLMHVQSLCDNKEMPHILTHWDTKIESERNVVNVHPHSSTLSRAFEQLIVKYEWRKFTLLYDDENSLAKVSSLLMMDNKVFRITVRQLELDLSWSYRTVLNNIKKSGETHFVVSCNVQLLEEFLQQAQQVGLVNDRYNYLIVNLDMHTLNLAPFQYAGCNITGVRLVDPEHEDLIDLAENLHRIKSKLGKTSETFFSHLAAWKINLKTALIVDAVSMFFETLKDFRSIKPKVLLCNGTDYWEHGYSIVNNIKTRSFKGLTGQIKFDTEGQRSEFVLDIVELTEGGLIKIGNWNSSNGINIQRSETQRLHDAMQAMEEAGGGTLRNKSFTVITALTPPYGMLKETTTQLSGNDRFEGYGIDLFHELSLMLGFNYTFVIQEDGANGNYDRNTKQWNGMIREIIDGRADLAITDLTITSERQSAVDFTMPFMNLGISILYRKPEPVPPSLFTFASPFSLQVWLLLGVAYFFVSFSLFLIGRLCPSEWTNPYPCIDDPEFLINQFTLKNSLWFTIGSLMQQGTEIAPIGTSTRMVAGIWWFFTLIIVSSYTANLAAFLTVETLVTPFKNIDELAHQMEISYGAKADGATSNFFRDSDIDTYKTIWKHLYKHPQYMTSDNDEGVKRVETENYAFLMESTTIEYMVERHCTLAQVGGLLDDKGYGIAMKKDSKYRNILTAAVLKLQESGKLTALKIKWWKEKRGGGNCQKRTGEATPLGLKNVEGVFFILFLGTVLGLIGTFIELAVYILHRNYKNSAGNNIKERFKAEYLEELKFIFKFEHKTKPVKKEIREEHNDEESPHEQLVLT